MIEQLREGRIVRLELKYCERCGGLLLRKSGDSVVYCTSCAKAFSEMPVLEKRECKGRSRAKFERETRDCQASDPCDSTHLTAVPRKPPQSVRIEASERRLG